MDIKSLSAFDEDFESDIESHAQELGYDMASGEVGTGWMEYTKGELESEGYDITSSDSVYEYAQGWEETLQMRHELETYSPVWNEIMSIEDSGVRIDYMSGFLSNWEAGYGAYICEVEGISC